MVKTIIITLDEDEHKRLLPKKKGRKWRDILYAGLNEPPPKRS